MANRNTKIMFKEPIMRPLHDTNLHVVTGQVTLGGGFYMFADLPKDVIDVQVLSAGEAVSVFYVTGRGRLNLEPTGSSSQEQVVTALVRLSGEV